MAVYRGWVFSGSLVEFLSEGAGSGGQWLAFQAAKGAIEGGKVLAGSGSLPSLLPMGIAWFGAPFGADDRGASPFLIGCSLGNRSGVAIDGDRSGDLLVRSFGGSRCEASSVGGGARWKFGFVESPSRLARGLPSWAEVQWHVAAQRWSPGTTEDRANCRRMELQLLRCRGGTPGARLKLILDGERGGVVRCEEVREVSKAEGIRYASQGAVCLAAELAMPAHVARGSVVDRAPLRAAGA